MGKYKSLFTKTFSVWKYLEATFIILCITKRLLVFSIFYVQLILYHFNKKNLVIDLRADIFIEFQ